MREIIRFYYSSNIEKPWCDIEKIKSQLRQISKAEIQVAIVDTTGMSRQELYEIYTEAYHPSVRKHFKIKQVFGSQNRSGVYFGREQPALLVYSGGSKYPSDIYPHDEVGKRILIEEYLERRIKQ